VTEALSDNVARSRFELGVDGEKGVVDYRRSGTTLYLTHAEVPASLAGHGLGTRLVRDTLDLIRRRNERMVAVCPFIKAFVRRNPDYAELSAQSNEQ
jgi:predicted GNAT family acetyltransferase